MLDRLDLTTDFRVSERRVNVHIKMSNRERGKVQVNLSSALFTHGYNLTKQHPNCHLYWCRILPLCKTVFHLYNSMGYSYVNLCKCAGMGGFVALSCIMRALQNACGATSSLTQTLTVRCGLSSDAHQLKCYSSWNSSPSPPLLRPFGEYCPFLSSCFDYSRCYNPVCESHSPRLCVSIYWTVPQV